MLLMEMLCECCVKTVVANNEAYIGQLETTNKIALLKRRSSTSSGGGPRASKTCFSLRVGALTVSNES